MLQNLRAAAAALTRPLHAMAVKAVLRCATPGGALYHRANERLWNLAVGTKPAESLKIVRRYLVELDRRWEALGVPTKPSTASSVKQPGALHPR